MSAPPEEPGPSGAWARRAEVDLHAAGHLREVNPCPAEVICYLCQQAVEKLPKAILLQEGCSFPRSHDLLLLRGLLPAPIARDLSIEALETLTRYAIEARYPGDWFPIDRAEARDALWMASEICARLRAAVRDGGS